MKSRFTALSTIVCALAWVTAVTVQAYDVQTDTSAYQVVMWKDGEPDSAVLVTGLYSNLDPDGRAEHPQCTVQAGRVKIGASTNWTIEVRPKGAWGVAEVRYPLLFLPRLTNDFLVTGKRIGQRIPMSYLLGNGERVFSGRPELYKGYPEYLNKTSLYMNRYPNQTTIQMMTYENYQEGVMIWTPDSQLWIKDFVIAASGLDRARLGKGLRAYVVHFPENTGQPGTGFRSPYPVLTTPYTGGWYNAAKIYREWGLKQWWCARGKLYDRLTTPAWVKDIHAFEGIAGRPEWVEHTLGAFVAPILGKRPFAAEYMNWSRHFHPDVLSSPEYMPPFDSRGFARNLAWSAHGAYLAPYFNFGGLTWEYKRLRQKLEPGLLRFADGGVPLQHWGTVDFAAIMKRKQKEMASEVREYGKRVLQYKNALRAAWSGPVPDALIQRLDEFAMDASLREAQKNLLRKNWGRDIRVIDRLKFSSAYRRLCLAYRPYMDYAVSQVCDCIHKYHPKMIYLDTFPLLPLPCFDRNHGHALGYGRHILQAQRELCSRILRQYPNMMLACESGAGEAFLDVMHFTFFKGIRPDYAIPLFPSIYNGYIAWTNWWMWPPYKTPESFTSNISYALHLGYIPGGAASGGNAVALKRLLKCEPDDIKVRFYCATIDIRRKYRDYLAAGIRLRDPSVEPAQNKAVEWAGKSSNFFYRKKLPVVLASRWSRNHDQTRGLILLSNWTGSEQNVKVAGLAVTLPAYSHKGLEVTLSPAGMSTPGISKSPAPTAMNSPPRTVNTQSSVYGKIMEVNAIRNLLTLDCQVLVNGKATRKRTSFCITPDTRFEKVEDLAHLHIGDNVRLPDLTGNRNGTFWCQTRR